MRESDPYIAPCAGDSSCTCREAIVIPPGTYYVLGDNRGFSDDNRFWGPIRRSWIIGMVILPQTP
ncbi:MAG: S26 family signal peptidase [Solirubrobacteraceae bacterium]